MKDFERAERILMDSGYFSVSPGSPGGTCPVQHSAELKDGRSYFFHSRGSAAYIYIFPEWAKWKDDGGLPDEKPEGEYETSYRWPDAGYISPVKASRLIVKWISFFYSEPWRRYDQMIRAARITKPPAEKTIEELEIDYEVAAAILAECFAYFAKQLAEEKNSETPNDDKVRTLEGKLLELKRDEMALGPENVKVINNALYVLAPLLRKSEL